MIPIFPLTMEVFYSFLFCLPSKRKKKSSLSIDLIWFSIRTVICLSKRKGKKGKKNWPVQHERVKRYFNKKYAHTKQIQAKKV